MSGDALPELSGIAARRRLLNLADLGARHRGEQAGMALVQLPALAAVLLQEMTGEPVLAYMAMGEEDVRALHDFILSRPTEEQPCDP